MADVPLIDPPLYEHRAAELKILYDRGSSIEMIASATGVSASTVQHAIRFAESGVRPPITGGKPTGENKGKLPKYRLIANDVSRLKAERMSTPKIIDWLLTHRGISVAQATVRRAWDFANPLAIEKAISHRTTPQAHGAYSHILAATRARVQTLLDQGTRTADIVARTRVSKNTVERLRKC